MLEVSLERRYELLAARNKQLEAENSRLKQEAEVNAPLVKQAEDLHVRTIHERWCRCMLWASGSPVRLLPWNDTWTNFRSAVLNALTPDEVQTHPYASLQPCCWCRV